MYTSTRIRLKRIQIRGYWCASTIVLHWLILCLFCFSSTNTLKEKEVVHQTHIDGLIAAFGDFDSDRFTDVFYISENGKSFQLLKSFEKKPELRQWPNIHCVFNHSDDIIASIIPGDFNGDAMLDVLVITQVNQVQSTRFNIWIFKGDRSTLDCDTSKEPLLNNALSQPLVIDYNGDMVADFIVQTEECDRQLWTFSNKQFTKKCPDQLQPAENERGMRFPNSNAFVNLNCQQDLIDFNTDIFISGRRKMEYWLDKGGFNLDVVYIPYPSEEKFILGQSAFVDLNIDGCIEHIIPVCEKLHDTPCDPQILWYDNEAHKWTRIFNLSESNTTTSLYFEVTRSLYGFDLPMTVRFGDVDGDGYVDLITIMKSNKNNKSIAVILKNVPDASQAKGRKFILYWTSEHLITDDVELVAFLDVQENGKLDMIMSTRNATGHYNIQWIANTMMEACFLKVLVTTGLCHGACPNEKVPYGTNQAGPFICYETSDVNGNLLKGCTTQLSQSNHFALQMPYSVFGLGETPNFVETVVASIPSGDMRPVRKSKWTQIVPDAQVVLIPYPPNETAYWICKLFYTPSSIVFSTLGTLSILCGILVIIILILHRKEVLEDIAEHEEYKRHWPESR